MNFWSENIDALWHVAKAYQRSGLTVFIGAGVSRGCGLPLWPDLARDLHTEVCRRSFPGDGAYGTYDAPEGWGGLAVARSSVEQNYLARLPLPIQSRFCKSRLGSKYASVLQQILYSRPYERSSTIRALVHLTHLRAVCTYNYDDLIESTSATGTFVPISGPKDADGGGVPVYHVHGLLPSDLASPPRGDLVFSEDEYHSMYMNFGHWSNLIQLSLLLESKCVLFIGLSFEDPNLRRILDAAVGVRQHLQLYNICRLPFSRPIDEHGSSPLSPNETQIELITAIYRDIGVTNVWIDEFEPDIPLFLSAIGKEDPIEDYTNHWRTSLVDRLSTLRRVGECPVLNCNEPAVEGFRFCQNHILGDRSRFMDFAPMPKILSDVCEVTGCERISSGLSGLCIEHLRTNVKADADRSAPS